MATMPGSTVDAVLSRYPAAVAGLAWVPLGTAGGFSGAAVWRGELRGEPLFCLKAWPAGYPADRLVAVHRWMRIARERSGADVVPRVVPTLGGATMVDHGDRAWDVTAWMPGAADFADRPSDARLAAACAALAAVHRAWAADGIGRAPCPGVRRRLDLLAGFAARPVSATPPDPTLHALAQQALGALRDRVPDAVAALLPWADRPGPVFPCLCDVWHEHVLFTGDRVTGVIDYGAMKVDHPAVDLARLLGDLVGDDRARWDVGLTAYRDAGGPVGVDADFAALLDRTGVVCGVIHWLRRLAGDGPPVADVAAARARFGKLVGRLIT